MFLYPFDFLELSVADKETEIYDRCKTDSVNSLVRVRRVFHFQVVLTTNCDRRERIASFLSCCCCCPSLVSLTSVADTYFTLVSFCRLSVTV